MYKSSFIQTETVWYLSLSMLNAIVATLFCITNIPANTLFWSIQSLLFSAFASIGHFSFLFLLIGFPGWLLIKAFKAKPILGLAWILITNMSFIFTIYLNFRIFELYKFHLNGMVLELITGGALQDILSFEPLVWILIFSVFVLFLLAGIVIGRLSYLALKRSQNKSLIALCIALIFLLSSLISQGIYIYSDAKGDTTITNIKRFIPWAQTITAKRKLREFGVEVTENKENSLNYQLNAVNYPKNPLQCMVDKNPNVLFIIVDSLRADMLSPEIMPNTWGFSENSHRYTQHHSVANSTRFGIFSLMYGLPGNYWQSMLNSQTSSLFIDHMIEKNYQFYINSAAPLYSPEFDRTVFTKLKDKINIGPKNAAAFKKDQHITKNFLQQIKNHPKDKAFFGFLFLDAPHSYSYPKSWKEKFKPSWDKINYLELNNTFDPKEFFNRYKNSAAFTDSLIGKILNDIKKNKLDDNTIIVFTSDHGQEFNETKMNFWGHNGNFSSFQTQVPLLIYWPKNHPLYSKEIFNHQTASIDLVPTLFNEGFGCTNSIEDYSTGLNLYNEDNNYQRPLLMESWSKRAIVGEDYIFVSHDINGNEIFTRDYQPKPSFSVPQKDINIIFREMSQFKQ